MVLTLPLSAYIPSLCEKFGGKQGENAFPSLYDASDYVYY